MSPAERDALETTLLNILAATLNLEGLLVPAPPLVNWKVRNRISFENGIPKGIYVQGSNTGANGTKQRVTAAPLPWDSSRTGSRFEIVHGEHWNTKSKYPRAEYMLEKDWLEFDREYAIETTFALSGTIPTHGEMVAVLQLHDRSNGSPPIALAIKDGRFLLYTRDNPSRPKVASPVVLDRIEPGRVYALRLEFKASLSTSGFARVLLDGVERSKLTGKIGHLSGAFAYIKTGLYDYDLICDSLIMHSDGLRVYER